MNARKPNSRLWRGLAAATVMVWLVAQFFCAVHCSSGKVSLASASAAKGCCKKAQDASQSSETQSTTCLMAKMIAPAPHTSADSLAPDHFQIATALLLAEILSSLHFESPSADRPAPKPDHVIAHELSLGSAARAHAPPVLA
jgi:hypothetical protein